MGGQVKADGEHLAEMASRLRESTTGLEGAAKSVPPMPEVSVSADKVSHTLTEITKTVAGLMAGVEQTASEIDASDGSYGEIDNTAATDLKRTGSAIGKY